MDSVIFGTGHYGMGLAKYLIKSGDNVVAFADNDSAPEFPEPLH